MRVNKSENYTAISNYHLKEGNMSLEAKGLLTLMLCLPKEWKYLVNQLIATGKESEESIFNILDELQGFGYLKRTQITSNKAKNRAKTEYIVDVFEYPSKESKICG